jgi:NADH dehydrogenase
LQLSVNPCADLNQTMSTDPKQILILGGGFAGVYTARRLEQLLGPDEASITLINRENYWVYQPILPEVISGSIGLTNVVSPIRHLCARTNLIMREVEDIDLKKQIATVSPGFRPRHLQLNYDHLVIALGTITNFHGMPGMIENAMPFRTLADAIVLRNHVIHVLRPMSRTTRNCAASSSHSLSGEAASRALR